MADRLGLRQTPATVITVAGTNGKGSCIKALQTLLLATGQTVGSYTSPHIRRYNERIVINGREVTDQQLIEAFAAVDAAREDISLTYFEFGTLAALYLFAQQSCGYWLLEVGLGGRLDATNVMTPAITVITSIALDHCEWLGATREAIGREKAGICRAGVPLVCADPNPPQSIQDTVDDLGLPLYRFGRDFGASPASCGQTYFGAGYRLEINTELAPPSVAAALQVTALLELATPEQWRDALASTGLPGRRQRVHFKGRSWVLDVAHNSAAFDFLWQRLVETSAATGWTVLLAMMKDKDIQACIEQCGPHVSHWVTAPLEGVERAMTPVALGQVIADTLNTEVQTCESFAQAMAACADLAGAGPILVAGSFHTVAEALQTIDDANGA